ncbi:hypothetical protein WB60_00110 [bacteria symbiont BFo2 of Frankliniella occidentalis]|nr:hypothetical protein WB60_00110 [bacteria symbiont BFo2 of Frankliniella occidentalis]
MRNHYFTITTADEAGRLQSRVIRHADKQLTAPVINAQLEEINAYQPVAVTSVSYLGKMSDSYFETGVKSLSDRLWPAFLAASTIFIALAAFAATRF